jgi:hypothetical protein
MHRQYRSITRGEFIVVAVDTASGAGDYTAAQFLSKTKVDVPLVYHSKKTTADYMPELSRTLEKIHDTTGVKPTVALERQNGGSFLIDRLSALNLAGKYDIFRMPSYGRVEPSDAVRLGWDTNTATRPKMLQELKNAVDNHALGIYDQQTIKEMFSFVVVQTASSWKAQAERNAHDDLVMSLAIAWQMYQICSPAWSANSPGPFTQYVDQALDEPTGSDPITGI